MKYYSINKFYPMPVEYDAAFLKVNIEAWAFCPSILFHTLIRCKEENWMDVRLN